MKSREEIVNNWLPRYTGETLENFGKYILLTNFSNYVEMFAQKICLDKTRYGYLV
jgi:AMP nucleosidase